MKKAILSLLIIFLTSVSWSQSRTIQFTSQQERNDFRPKWNESVEYHDAYLMAVVTKKSFFKSNAITEEKPDSIPTPYVLAQASDEVAAVRFMSEHKCTMVRYYEGVGIQVYRMPFGTDFKSLQAEAMKTSIFKTFEQDLITEASNEAVPNDSLYATQYAFQRMKVSEALDKITTNTKGLITIIDGHGFDTGHPDMQGVFYLPYNAVTKTTNVFPESSYDRHGTCCAGIPGAIFNNYTGVAGLGGNKLMVQVIKIGYNLNAQGSFNTSTLIQVDAINKAIDAGSNAISMSFGSIGYSQGFFDAITKARTLGRGGKGIPVFGSTGNSGTSVWTNYPASYSGVIAVGSTTNGDARSSFSNYGNGVTLSAPGSGVTTTDIRGTWGYHSTDYFSFSGTSASCPVAATIGALMTVANPELTEAQVKSMMQLSCDQVGNYTYSNGRCAELGAGRVNASAAIDLALGYTPPPQYHDLTLSLCQVSSTAPNIISTRVTTNKPSLPTISASVEFRWSSDAVFNDTDSLIATSQVELGRSIQTIDCANAFTPTKSGYIVMKVFANGTEENVNNNTCYTSFTVIPPPAPDDLKIEVEIASATWQSNGNTIVRYRYKNPGAIKITSGKMKWGFNTNPVNVKSIVINLNPGATESVWRQESYPRTPIRPCPFSIMVYELNGKTLNTPIKATVTVN